MGVHTGDSITVAPAQTLTDREYQKMRDVAIAVMREIGVETGGSNVQFAVNPVDRRTPISTIIKMAIGTILTFRMLPLNERHRFEGMWICK